jgi:hypothetical protein
VNYSGRGVHRDQLHRDITLGETVLSLFDGRQCAKIGHVDMATALGATWDRSGALALQRAVRLKFITQVGDSPEWDGRDGTKVQTEWKLSDDVRSLLRYLRYMTRLLGVTVDKVVEKLGTGIALLAADHVTSTEQSVLEAAIYDRSEVGNDVRGHADSVNVSFGANPTSTKCEVVRDEGRPPLPAVCPWCERPAVVRPKFNFCVVCRNTYRGEDRSLAWVSAAQWRHLHRHINVGALPTTMTMSTARRRAIFAIDTDERTFWSTIAGLAPEGNSLGLECGHNPASRFFAFGLELCGACTAWVDAKFAPRRESAEAAHSLRPAADEVAEARAHVDAQREADMLKWFS